MADKSKKRKLVVLEEGALLAAALNPAVAAAFPFLSPVARVARSAPKPGCGRCGRAATERARLFTAAKQAIAGMDATRKRQLKDLLNAHQLRVVYNKPAGGQEVLTF